MTVSQRLMAGLASMIVMAIIIDLVRRRRLREEYALLWLGSGMVILLLAISHDIIPWLAALMGIEHPAYALFVIALFVGMVLAIHFTVILSKLTAQNWRLTQEIGLLRQQLEETKSPSGSDSQRPAE